MTVELPTWEQMSDLDKGAALLHLWKRDWEGEDYAEEEYPCEYLDDPKLKALSNEDSCVHAVEVQRLYNLALKADEQARRDRIARQS